MDPHGTDVNKARCIFNYNKSFVCKTLQSQESAQVTGKNKMSYLTQIRHSG